MGRDCSSLVAPNGEQARVLEFGPQSYGRNRSVDGGCPLDRDVQSVALNRLRSGERPIVCVEQFDKNLAESGLSVEMKRGALEVDRLCHDFTAVEGGFKRDEPDAFDGGKTNAAFLRTFV